MKIIISLGSAKSSAITGTTTPEDFIHDIQSGRWAKEIAALRAATGDDAEKLKAQLPGVLWTGKFTIRNKTGIKKFSGCLCADIDKVAERVVELLYIARMDPHVIAAFVSPSGTGIKIVFRVPIATDEEQHKQNFATVRAYVNSHYDAKVDEQAKDVPRLCFVSHDPNAFYHGDAVPLVSTSKTSPALNPASYIPTSAASCISTSSASLHNKAEVVLANIIMRGESLKKLVAKYPQHPEIVHFYEKLVEQRYQAKPHERNKFVVDAIPFLHCAVADGIALDFAGCFYDCNRSLFHDTAEQHLKEAAAMLKSVAKTYAESLHEVERSIYDTLPEKERVAFRICRDLAKLKTPAREPQTFFLSFNHLSDRLGIFPMQAQRIMWQLENYGLIKLLKKGTRRAAGVRGEAGIYQWQLPL